MNMSESSLTPDELHELYPDLFQVWWDRGYTAGRLAEKRSDAEVNQLRAQVSSYKQTINNFKQALKQHGLKVISPGGKVKKKHYTPPVANRKIVQDARFCIYCGEKATTADHLTPKSRGGHDGYGNLAPCCYHCNQEKGNMTYDEYMTWRKYHYSDDHL